MLIIVILVSTSDDHLCKKKKIQEYSCVKRILNQQELPTIADCQVLRIGFIDHQIFLQNKSTHKKKHHTNLTRKLEKNLKVHFISALTTITLGYNSLSAEILDHTYQMISSPEAYDMHKQS